MVLSTLIFFIINPFFKLFFCIIPTPIRIMKVIMTCFTQTETPKPKGKGFLTLVMSFSSLHLLHIFFIIKPPTVYQFIRIYIIIEEVVSDYHFHLLFKFATSNINYPLPFYTILYLYCK